MNESYDYEPEWHEHPCYWKLLSDERRYEAMSKCDSPYCGLTALVLSVILLAPLLLYFYECFIK